MPNPKFQQHYNQDDASLSELMRRFAQDAGALVQHEIALAKLEIRESVKAYLSNGSKLAIAAVVALFGVFALMAALVVGLGSALDNYWLSALVVAVVLFAAAGVLASTGLKGIQRIRTV